jgi:carboxymethylenebutenolidase
MRDDDRMMDLPDEFGSGVVGVCDICGTRQAVIVLQKERYKLCVIDFLNKTWLKSEKKPGAPAPLYRSDRIWFDSSSTPGGKAPGIVLTPTKIVRHPVLLITPDVYGITTVLLDAAIRFARDGYEVLIPDVAKTNGVGPTHHLALRTSVMRGGVSSRSKKILGLVNLYSDALGYLRSREMVETTKSAVFGASYGGSLALALAAQDTRLAAVALAYPQPVSPPDLARLVTAPIFFVGGTADSGAEKARRQLEAVRGPGGPTVEVMSIAGAHHGFLGRDLSGYDLVQAEAAWARMQSFLKAILAPPPPRPPQPPVKPSDPLAGASPGARPPTAPPPKAAVAAAAH